MLTLNFASDDTLKWHCLHVRLRNHLMFETSSYSSKYVATYSVKLYSWIVENPQMAIVKDVMEV